MTTLHITIGDRDSLREETLRQLDDASTDDEDDVEQWGDRRVLSFGSYDDLVEHLSPMRLSLVRAIAEHEPESMRETARIVDRDVSDVHGDLKQLALLDVIELADSGPGQSTQPIVPYERIEVDIAVPLVDDEPSSDKAEV
ncbi:transcriptional regulator [Halobacteria archaeon HArc-gm2]|nr:transcriptional regulator [Halobacteria archaeon HArc-gm2]